MSNVPRYEHDCDQCVFVFHEPASGADVYNHITLNCHDYWGKPTIDVTTVLRFSSTDSDYTSATAYRAKHTIRNNVPRDADDDHIYDVLDTEPMADWEYELLMAFPVKDLDSTTSPWEVSGDQLNRVKINKKKEGR